MTQKIDENITELIFEDDREILKVAKKSITPKCDFWFKKIFGEHKDICKDFIESIIIFLFSNDCIPLPTIV